METGTLPERSQCQPFGGPAPRTWDDYERDCIGTYGGGYRTNEEREIFHHGMSTIFNLLRGEFPSAVACKAAPDLLDALRELCDIFQLVVDTGTARATIDSFTLQPARAAIAKAVGS